MPYTDLNTVHNPATGTVIPASWGDQVRTNQEFFIDPPAASVFNSAAQSVSNATDTELTADSENYDNDSMHSTSTNTSRITIQTAGRYLLIATVKFAADATGHRVGRFLENGTTQHITMSVGAAPATAVTTLTLARSFVAAAGDYFEVQVIQNSGSALDVTLEEYIAMYLTR